jgi:single-stranded DNA-binding protein
MQNVVFTGRLAADPWLSEDRGKAAFRLVERRGRDAEGRPRLVGVGCVSWIRGLNGDVVAAGLVKGCEATVVGRFAERRYTTRGGGERVAKELVVGGLTVLDWAADRPAADAGAAG